MLISLFLHPVKTGYYDTITRADAQPLAICKGFAI